LCTTIGTFLKDNNQKGR